MVEKYSVSILPIKAPLHNLFPYNLPIPFQVIEKMNFRFSCLNPNFLLKMAIICNVKTTYCSLASIKSVLNDSS